jgi:acetyl esterase/lipase
MVVAFAQPPSHERLSLWPSGAPGSAARKSEPEQAKDYWVKNVHDPSVEVYLPPPDKATGAAVVVVPGGGHRLLVYNAEGREPAEFLANLGVAAFALKYRLAREEGSTYTIEGDAVADTYRALRLVRSRAGRVAHRSASRRRHGVLGRR